MRILKPAIVLLIGISFILFVSSLNFSETDKTMLYFGGLMFLMLFLVWAIWRTGTKEEVDLTFQNY